MSPAVPLCLPNQTGRPRCGRRHPERKPGQHRGRQLHTHPLTRMCAPEPAAAGRADPDLRAVQGWTKYCQCGPDVGPDSLFVVNMERDSAPVYRSLLEGKAGDNGFGFDTEELSGYLAETLDARRSHSKAQTRLEVPGRVSDTLLTHLSQALGIIAK